ncbi:MAG: nucleotidyltransferase family protein [Alphaproteobacteria bacterium]|nr:nucleotidyltransferase family protein [Alphaproteobacteria bacterium]
MRVCAVIPAAGRGTRLGADGPKILTPLTAQETIWSILRDKLAPLVNHIHLILSPEGAAAFPPLPASVSTSIQPAPTGMGDAIFRGYDVWSKYDAVLVVWGDQVFVSSDTLKRALAALTVPERYAVLPVTRMVLPYVEYVFDGTRLTKVLQTREGDATTPHGYSDVGTFLLGTAGLKSAWGNFLAQAPRGAATAEVNFLPFLPFLSSQGWTITPLEVADATEARGINTKTDLAFFQSLYKNAP